MPSDQPPSPITQQVGSEEQGWEANPAQDQAAPAEPVQTALQQDTPRPVTRAVRVCVADAHTGLRGFVGDVMRGEVFDGVCEASAGWAAKVESDSQRAKSGWASRASAWVCGKAQSALRKAFGACFGAH